MIGLGSVAKLELVLVRVEGFAAGEFVKRTAQRVGAGLEQDVDHSAGRSSVLRVVAVGDDLELLHRVDRWHVRDVVAADERIVGRAVEQEFVVAILAAVDRPVRDRAVVKRTLEDGRPVVGDARRQVRQHEGIARVQRQLSNALVINHDAAIRVGHIEQRRLGSDVHRLGNGAKLQRDIDRDGLAHFQLHAFVRMPAEAGQLG